MSVLIPSRSSLSALGVRVPGIVRKLSIVKTPWALTRALLFYLDEAKKLYPNRVEDGLAKGVGYVESSEPRPIYCFGHVAAALRDRGVADPADDPLALLDWWTEATRSRKKKAHHIVFGLHPVLVKRAADSGIPIDALLLSATNEAITQWGSWFYPHDQLGWTIGIHHDTQNPHVHCLLYPATASGRALNVSCLSKAKMNGQDVRIDFQGALVSCYVNAVNRHTQGLILPGQNRDALLDQAGFDWLAIDVADDLGTKTLSFAEMKAAISQTVDLPKATLLRTAVQDKLAKRDVLMARYSEKDFRLDLENLQELRDGGERAAQELEKRFEGLLLASKGMFTRPAYLPHRDPRGGMVSVSNLAGSYRASAVGPYSNWTKELLTGVADERINAAKNFTQTVSSVEEYLQQNAKSIVDSGWRGTLLTMSIAQQAHLEGIAPYPGLRPNAPLARAILGEAAAAEQIRHEFDFSADRAAQAHRSFDISMTNKLLSPYSKRREVAIEQSDQAASDLVDVAPPYARPNLHPLARTPEDFLGVDQAAAATLLDHLAKLDQSHTIELEFSG